MNLKFPQQPKVLVVQGTFHSCTHCSLPSKHEHVIPIDLHQSLLTHDHSSGTPAERWQQLKTSCSVPLLHKAKLDDIKHDWNRGAQLHRLDGHLERAAWDVTSTTTDLVRVQCEVGSQQAACVGVVVVLHLIHVVRWVPDLHVDASVAHGLPLDTLPPEESWRRIKMASIIFTQFSGFIDLSSAAAAGSSLFIWRLVVYLFTSASVCRRKHPLPPPQSRLPAGPEAR